MAGWVREWDAEHHVKLLFLLLAAESKNKRNVQFLYSVSGFENHLLLSGNLDYPGQELMFSWAWNKHIPHLGWCVRSPRHSQRFNPLPSSEAHGVSLGQSQDGCERKWVSGKTNVDILLLGINTGCK